LYELTDNKKGLEHLRMLHYRFWKDLFTK
jgi:hypothetical protein